MKRNIVNHTKKMKGFDCPEGEPLFIKLSRAMNSGEPIQGGAEIVSTERKDGVLPQYNIKTDRFEVALEAYDNIAKAHIAQRDNYINPKDLDNDGGDKKPEGGTNPDNADTSGNDNQVSA